MTTENQELVKPRVDFDEVRNIVFDMYGLKVLSIRELNGYDDKNFHIVVDETVNSNAHIEKCFNDGYVLKIVNSLDSKNKPGFEAQTELLWFLNQNGIRCPKPVVTKEQKSFGIISLVSGTHVVRLLEYISGDILYKLENTNERLYFDVGVFTAKIDLVLQKFDHPAYHKYMQWCLGSAPDILNYLHAVEESRQTLIKKTISEFKLRVIDIQDELAKGIIHGDINEQNLIIDASNEEVSVKALIDFGDTHYCCYLYELALAMTYMISLTNNIDSAGYVLGGYSSFRNITENEFQLLKICVMTRFCQSLVLGAFANLREPENKYVLTTARKGWKLLEELMAKPEDDVLHRWKELSLQKL
ncbi:hydroxylysine kinase [Euwallacea fornicatus]|uniref:hydroxylysine kinase n=1 Tax=Euwallacea fornicatus TaxID=995702 RepID=UPI00338D9247